MWCKRRDEEEGEDHNDMRRVEDGWGGESLVVPDGQGCGEREAMSF